MYIWLCHFWKGCIKIEICGQEMERFLGLCAAQNVDLWDVRAIPDGCECWIARTAFYQLNTLRRKTKVRIRLKRKYGLPFLLRRYKNGRMFVAGLGVCLFFLLWSTSRVWCIEIEGNMYYSSQKICESLESYGCHYGSRKKDLDLAEIENALRKDYPQISWASIRLDGTYLKLQLQESLTPEKNEVVLQHGELIADRKGKVVSILTRSGTPRVKVGDIVEKGSVLVSDKVEFQQDSGEITEEPCVVDADVYLRTTRTVQHKFCMTYRDEEQTGRSRMIYALRFWNGEIKIPFWRRPYAKEKIFGEVHQIQIAKNWYLPIWYSKQNAVEYQETERTYQKEEIDALAKHWFFDYVSNLQQKNVEILQKNVIIDIKNGFCVATGRIESVECVSTRRPGQKINDHERQ